MHKFLGLDPTEWIAIASVLNTVTGIILAVITFVYARSAHRQAQASEAQAKAAKAQAEAASAQASAARETLSQMREDSFSQKERVRMLISATISSGLKLIEFWTNSSTLATLAATGTLPDEIDLLPDSAGTATDAARLISADLTSALGSAFDYMKLARMEIDILKTSGGQRSGSFWAQRSDQVLQYLRDAERHLRDAASKLLGA